MVMHRPIHATHIIHLMYKELYVYPTYTNGRENAQTKLDAPKSIHKSISDPWGTYLINMRRAQYSELHSPQTYLLSSMLYTYTRANYRKLISLQISFLDLKLHIYTRTNYSKIHSAQLGYEYKQYIFQYTIST